MLRAHLMASKTWGEKLVVVEKDARSMAKKDKVTQEIKLRIDSYQIPSYKKKIMSDRLVEITGGWGRDGTRMDDRTKQNQLGKEG